MKVEHIVFSESEKEAISEIQKNIDSFSAMHKDRIPCETNVFEMERLQKERKIKIELYLKWIKEISNAYMRRDCKVLVTAESEEEVKMLEKWMDDYAERNSL